MTSLTKALLDLDPTTALRDTQGNDWDAVCLLDAIRDTTDLTQWATDGAGIHQLDDDGFRTGFSYLFLTATKKRAAEILQSRLTFANGMTDTREGDTMHALEGACKRIAELEAEVEAATKQRIDERSARITATLTSVRESLEKLISK